MHYDEKNTTNRLTRLLTTPVNVQAYIRISRQITELHAKRVKHKKE